MKSSRMTTYILIAMVLGIAVGAVVHDQFADPALRKVFAGYVSIGSTIFLRLIKMIIGPLVSGYLIQHELLTTWGMTASVIAAAAFILALRSPSK